MTDRLTDAALDEIEAAVGDLVPIDPSDLVALVAEVREHRAARTLREDEVQHLTNSEFPHCRACRRIIDRITEEASDPVVPE